MAQAQTEAKPIVNRTQALVWLRQMMLIRRFEEQAEMLSQKGNKIGGFFHQYSGQEPVAVGSIGVLTEDDYIITAYRDHGHALARGVSRRGNGAWHLFCGFGHLPEDCPEPVQEKATASLLSALSAI